MQSQYTFFKSQKLSQLRDYFPGYAHYFQETLWFLQQKFFGKLLHKFAWVAPELLDRVYQLQQRQIAAGIQKHLGEILLKNQSDASEQIVGFLKESGSEIVVCPRCRQYFYNQPAFSGMQSDCPQCELAMEAIQPPVNILLASLRNNFLQPYPLWPAKECYPAFLFVDINRYLQQQPEQLEQEIQLILQACDLWIDNISVPELPPEKFDARRARRQRSRQKFCVDPLAVTNAISRQLIALNIFSDSVQRRSAGPAGAAHFSPLFCGYLQNLHELFWLLTQKIFCHSCREIYDLDAEQIAEALQLQQENFNEGMPLHLAEVLLGQHQLSREQLAAIFTEIGYRLYFCRDCQQCFGQITALQGAIACPRCSASLAPGPVTAEFIPWVLAVPCFRPLFLYKEKEAACPEFVFFKKGPQSPIDFEIAAQDLELAWHQFQRRQSGSADDESELDLALGTSQELSVLMQSLEHMLPANDDALAEDPDAAMTVPDEASARTGNEPDALSDTQSVSKGAISQEISRLMQSMAEVDSAADESFYDRLPSGVFDKCRVAIKKINIDPGIRREKELVKSSTEMPGQMGISQEISRLLQSMDNLDASSDEAFYDRMAKSQERLADNAAQEQHSIDTCDPQEKLREIPTDEERVRHAIPTAVEAPPSRPSKLKRWPLALAASILLTVGYLLYTQLWPAWSLPDLSGPGNSKIVLPSGQPSAPTSPVTTTANSTKVPDNSDTSGETKAGQVAEHRLTSAPPQKNYRNLSLPPSPLQHFLGQNPSKERIAEKLIALANNRALARRDLETLKAVYQQYGQPKLRNLIIQAAGAIRSEESRQWLQSLLQNAGNDSEQVYALEALQKWEDRQSVLIIMQALHSATTPAVISACVRSLSSPGSKDEQVYQALCNKLYEIDDRDVHLVIVASVGRSKISERKSFFERILLDSRYDFVVRKQALEKLLDYADQENDTAGVSQILLNLSRIVQHPALKRRVERALKVVTRH